MGDGLRAAKWKVNGFPRDFFGNERLFVELPSVKMAERMINSETNILSIYPGREARSSHLRRGLSLISLDVSRLPFPVGNAEFITCVPEHTLVFPKNDLKLI